MLSGQSQNKTAIIAFLVFGLTGMYSLLKIYRNSINFADATQGGIWNYLLLVLMGVGIFALLSIIASLSERTMIVSSPIKMSIAYTMVVWINGLLTLSITNAASVYYFIVAPCFALVLCAMYCAYDEKLPLLINRLWYGLWCVILCLLFYSYVHFFSMYAYYESGDKIALNNSYYAACAIPFFLRRNDKLGFFMTFFSCLVVFISNKRTGLIAILFALVAYYLIKAKMNGSIVSFIKRISLGSIFLLVLLFVFSLIDSKYQLGVFLRLDQIFEDGGSGRTVIYEYVFNEIMESNLFNILLGHGTASITTLKMGLSSAHNDFLNIYYEYGLTAVLLIVFFYFSLVASLKKMIDAGYVNSSCFAFSIIISLFFSFFSANLDNQSFSLILAVYWGVELASWDKFRAGLTFSRNM